jgi:hypothetical protein
MGSVTYDFLANSILFNEDSIEKSFEDVSVNQLEKVLADYRQHCLKNIAELTNEIKSRQSSLKVFSSIEEMKYETLLQSALYIDQFIIDDPLFKLTHAESEHSKVVTEYLGFQKNGLDKEKLTEAVKFLKAITPMIVSEYVKFIPASIVFEPPKETLVYYSPNYFSDALPKELMEFCHKNIVVRSMAKVEGGWRILDKNDLTPGLFIDFKNSNSSKGYIYHYFEQEFLPTEDPKVFNTKMHLASYPMDKAIWEVWAHQSMNRSSESEVNKVYTENIIAADLKATYLCDNDFTAQLIVQNFPIKETIETATATQLINLQLPFLDKIKIDKLMDVRTYEEDVFTNFRLELERQFRELRTVSDPIELKARQENIVHELNDVGVKKIQEKLDSLKRKGFFDAAILVGGLAGSVQTAGWSLLASANAVAQGYRSYLEYKSGIKENPSYLLWKVLKK